MNDIPILIPIKEHSERCPQKNKHLLPFTAKYLEQQGRLSSAWVISESTALLELAQSLNFKTFLEKPLPGQTERTACWSFLQLHYSPEFLLCPVTQPFRSKDLITDMEDIYYHQHDIDFITAINIVPDRSQFYVQQKEDRYVFNMFSECRMGATCKNVTMVDGSLYLIRTSFLNGIVHSEDPTSAFWNARFNCVINKAPFMDIDTEDDLYKFNYLSTYFLENSWVTC
jgi:pseudaminic acid cytidylyltransferase